jgi:superfamily II DNA/RNA helicase
MWTATWDREVEAVAREYFRSYVRLHVGSDKLHANENIKQDMQIIKEHERFDQLVVRFYP